MGKSWIYIEQSRAQNINVSCRNALDFCISPDIVELNPPLVRKSAITRGGVNSAPTCKSKKISAAFGGGAVFFFLPKWVVITTQLEILVRAG